jgi:hypothetical protein
VGTSPVGLDRSRSIAAAEHRAVPGASSELVTRSRAGNAEHRIGGPEVLDVVDLPDPVPGPGEELFEVSSAGINYADTHQPRS